MFAPKSNVLHEDLGYKGNISAKSKPVRFRYLALVPFGGLCGFRLVPEVENLKVVSISVFIINSRKKVKTTDLTYLRALQKLRGKRKYSSYCYPTCRRMVNST